MTNLEFCLNWSYTCHATNALSKWRNEGGIGRRIVAEFGYSLLAVCGVVEAVIKPIFTLIASCFLPENLKKRIAYDNQIGLSLLSSVCCLFALFGNLFSKEMFDRIPG